MTDIPSLHHANCHLHCASVFLIYAVRLLQSFKQPMFIQHSFLIYHHRIYCQRLAVQNWYTLYKRMYWLHFYDVFENATRSQWETTRPSGELIICFNRLLKILGFQPLTEHWFYRDILSENRHLITSKIIPWKRGF